MLPPRVNLLRGRGGRSAFRRRWRGGGEGGAGGGGGGVRPRRAGGLRVASLRPGHLVSEPDRLVRPSLENLWERVSLAGPSLADGFRARAGVVGLVAWSEPSELSPRPVGRFIPKSGLRATYRA